MQLIQFLKATFLFFVDIFANRCCALALASTEFDFGQEQRRAGVMEAGGEVRTPLDVESAPSCPESESWSSRGGS